MSEKRFNWKCDDENCCIYDTKEEKAYFNVEVVDLLNEQHATISALRTENNHLIDVIKEYAKKYEEQQSIIKAKDEEILKLKKDIIILQKRIELYKKL